MKRRTHWWSLLCAGAWLGIMPVMAQHLILHQFDATEGGWSYGTPTVSGSNIFALLRFGPTGMGALISNNGPVHNFTGSPGDGDNMFYGAPALAGNTLYGTTYAGGANRSGVVFRVQTDGSGHTILRDFAGSPGDGAAPESQPIVANGWLYGTTAGGGINNMGTLYKMDTNGAGYTVLHHFTGALADGAYPRGTVTLSGDVLYGVTGSGGSNNYGVVYRLKTDGTGYAVLRHMTDSGGRGAAGALLLSGETLYGTTEWGGVSNVGTLFALNTNGAGYTVLHNFAGGTNDGFAPVGDLLRVGNMLYGMTPNGGNANTGIVFRIHTNGTLFKVLHSFTGGNNDGSVPRGSLALFGGKLLGLTFNGGSNGMGVAFTQDVCPPQLYYHEPGGTLASWILSPTGAFLEAQILGATSGWKLKAAGDIDGDSVPDLLFQTAANDTGGWFMHPDGTARDQRFWWNTGAWEIRACADYDGTGRAQLLFQTPGGDTAYWQLQPDGTFSNAVLLGNQGGWQLRAAGDLGNDGRADLFWQNSAGTVVAWLHHGDGSIEGKLIGNTGLWQLRGAADIDGDGLCDLVWQTPDGRTGGWFMNADGTARSASFWWGTGAWLLKAASH